MANLEKILLVEEDVVVRKKILNVLRRLDGNYEILTASSGIEACEKANSDMVGLIVLSWELENDLTCLQVINKVRQNPKTQDIHILLITGSKHDAYLRHSVQNRYTDFLSRPIHASKLLNRVGYLLKKRELYSYSGPHNLKMPATKEPVSEKKLKRHILFSFSEPRDMQPIRSQEEMRGITKSFWEAGDNHRFVLESIFASRVKDLIRAIRKFKPHIVHISGHGNQHGDLFFQDGDSLSASVSKEALGELFAFASEYVDCVFLNSCSSLNQALIIHEHIPNVIGIPGKIETHAAMTYSLGFYDHLAHGKTISEAHKYGIMMMKMNGFVHGHRPKLLSWKRRQRQNMF